MRLALSDRAGFTRTDFQDSRVRCHVSCVSSCPRVAATLPLHQPTHIDSRLVGPEAEHHSLRADGDGTVVDLR